MEIAAVAEDGARKIPAGEASVLRGKVCSILKGSKPPKTIVTNKLAGQTSFVKNSKHFVEDKIIREDEVMVSFDVKFLFTNCPWMKPYR